MRDNKKMSSFKDIAYQILKETKKPLHSREITSIVLKRGLLKTSGKTPEATMNAQLIVDINKNKENSRFIKTAPSVFALNPKHKVSPKPIKKEKVTMPLSEEFVKNSIIKWFSQNGWAILEISNLRGQGVDIKAKKGNRYFFIETKGGSEKRQGNEVRFVYGLGQIITRMRVIARHAYLYGLALPTPAANIAKRRIPWQVAQKLTLYIFSISKDGKIKQHSWQELKQEQSS